MFVLAVFFVACSGAPEEKAEKVLTDFLIALEQGDYETARKLSTKEAKALLGMMEAGDEKMIEEVKDVKCTMDDENQASCTFCCFVGNGTPEETKVKVKKVDGKWLVDFVKEGF